VCYVSGGTNIGDHWPWEARELDPQKPFNETVFPKHRQVIWLLKTSIIGNYCISHPEDTILVGDLTCLGQKFYNDTAQETQWWGAPNHTEPQPHPLASFFNFRKAWDNLTWWAPGGCIGPVGNKLTHATQYLIWILCARFNESILFVVSPQTK
jgi:hypothetical protein